MSMEVGRARTSSGDRGHTPVLSFTVIPGPLITQSVVEQP